VDGYEAVQKKKAGYESEKYYIGRVREYFKGRIVQDIAVEDVERFLQYMEDLPKHGGGKRSATDINHHMRVLYSILKKAVLRDWIAKNSADPEKVKRPAKSKGRTQKMEVEEVGRLLEASAPHLYSIILCQVETGMRVEETDGLRWSELGEVKLKDGSSVPMICLPAERTKTRQPRKIPVTPSLAAHLDALREARKSPKVVSLSDLVFQYSRPRRDRRKGEKGPQLVSAPVRDTRPAWAAALKKAKLDSGFQRRDLRRTFRSHMKEAGADTFTLNEIMGHANPKIEKTYTKLSDDHLVRTMGLVPNWNSHKTSTSDGEQEKGLRYETTQPFDYLGAEEGS